MLSEPERACARGAHPVASWLWHLPRRGLIGLVSAYRFLLRPWLGSACRFEPTCSTYALQALHRHGAVCGAGLTAWRLARCHPWCQGGMDPVPTILRNPMPGLFTRLMPAQNRGRPPRSSSGKPS